VSLFKEAKAAYTLEDDTDGSGQQAKQIKVTQLQSEIKEFAHLGNFCRSLFNGKFS